MTSSADPDATTSGPSNTTTASGTTATTSAGQTEPSYTTRATTARATPTPTTVHVNTPTPTTIPPTATPTAAPPSSSFPYIHYGTLFNNAYANASATYTSSDGKAKISQDLTASGVILVRIDGTTKTCKAIVATPSSSFQYTLTPGVWTGLPANGGSGGYTISIFEQVEGTTYMLLLNQSLSVSLANSLKPYLAASVLVNYSSGSQAVSLAGSLTSGIGTADGKVSAVYQWITSHISYDHSLASLVTSNAITSYVPNLDATVASGTGICFDYAALMAGMLRSQGIPTRLIMGYVPQGYHAWNEVYFQGTGWVIVADFQVKYVDGSGYVMFDSTFGAGGLSIDQINQISHSVQKIY